MPNVHHTRLIARAVSEVGTPYYAVTVTVDQFTDPQTGKTYATDSAITNPEGNCEVTEFFPGFRTATISGENIQTTTFPAIEFRRGKAETREFIVAPAFNNIPSPAQEEKAENQFIRTLVPVSFRKPVSPGWRVFLLPNQWL